MIEDDYDRQPNKRVHRYVATERHEFENGYAVDASRYEPKTEGLAVLYKLTVLHNGTPCRAYDVEHLVQEIWREEHVANVTEQIGKLPPKPECDHGKQPRIGPVAKFLRRRKIKEIGRIMISHMGWLDQLGQMRLRQLEDIQKTGLSRFTKGIVLATNYEMAGHATDAFQTLRRLDEVGLDEKGQIVLRETKAWMEGYVNLPALARRDLDSAPDEEIDRLWEVFGNYEHTKSLEETMALGIIWLESTDRDEVFDHLVPDSVKGEERREANRKVSEIMRDYFRNM